LEFIQFAFLQVSIYHHIGHRMEDQSMCIISIEPTSKMEPVIPHFLSCAQYKDRRLSLYCKRKIAPTRIKGEGYFTLTFM